VIDWFELERELDRWDDPLRPASMWWRDDDACRESPLLERVLALSRAHAIPLGLAVIPAAMTPGFSNTLPRLDPGVQVLQHGFAHRNHAGAGEKKSEFGEHRPPEVMRDEISRGARMLRAAASERVVPVFVPPWNRIARPLLSALPDLGFQAVSTFGASTCTEPAPGLRRINAHVDLIDWRGDRRCKGGKRVLADLVAHLKSRRAESSDQPTGILSHHLAHDEGCWRFLDGLFAVTAKRGNVRWLSPSEVLRCA
jgi:hypothetical protein